MTEQATRLTLRPLRTSDEHTFAEAHAAFSGGQYPFGFGYQPGMPWEDYLRGMSDLALGQNLAQGLVPATFLIADVDGVMVGRTSIRHELNDFLREIGGHIGYAVLPEHRRLGYATEILRQSLRIARTIGIDEAIVTCDDDNPGSYKTIEANGGRLQDVVTVEGRPVPLRRYRI